MCSQAVTSIKPRSQSRERGGKGKGKGEGGKGEMRGGPSDCFKLIKVGFGIRLHRI